MVQIVLIRPGMTDFDVQGRITGRLDIPLNEQGAEDVARTANELRDVGVVAVVSSPGQSAKQTAQAIAAVLGVKAKTIDNLRNLNHGLWEGTLVEDVKRKHPKVYRQWQEHPDHVCPPDGEMLGEARVRVETALSKLLKKHKEGVVAVIVPDPLASVVRSHLLGSELGNLWKSNEKCGRWELITPPSPLAAHPS